ncbi:GumC family protein [Tunturiibacter psychrotolerans]|uniref:GumC family protein n=1 Tax=Tunturiibacter psychrotolerans TaxID=3069686 RepID=UPI003D1A41FF
MNTKKQAEDMISQTSSPLSDGPLDLLDILVVLARKRRMIVVVTLIAFLLGSILSFLLRPKFTAKAVIMPPQQQTSSSALLNQLGSLASLGGGGAAALGLKTPADLYIGILQSRTIADNIIAKYDLQSVYKRKTSEDSRAMLKSRTDIESGKDGLIQISVTDRDPNRARDLANAYVHELYDMNSNLAISEAAQRRVFFDQQLNGERKELAQAEEDLRATQQKTGLIQLTGQAQMLIQSIAQLRAQISNREVELESLRTYATDQNPDVTRLSQEIATMRAQLVRLEDDPRSQTQQGDITVPAGRVPSDSLEYVRRFRELKYHETLFDLLSRQYEAARIDEAKSAPIIQVVDKAVTPDKKSSPKRTLITVGFAVFGFAFASAVAFAQDAIRRAERSPQRAMKLDDLRSQFRRVS